MHPTVSIVIPTYNRENIICKAIDSALSQTFKNLEIIIIDDGSTDRTKTVLEKYGARLHYFYQENRGISGARNTGINRCSGDYVAFLDSDDYWLPEKLEKQIALFQKHPEYGMVACQCASIGPDGEFRQKNRPGKSGSVLLDLFKKNFIRTSSAVIKKDCFLKAGLFDETLKECEEYDLWLRIAACCDVGFINEPLAVYTDNPKGASTDSLRGRLYRLQVLEKDYLKQTVPDRLYRKRIADTCHYIGRHWAKRGGRKESLSFLKKAQQLHPFYLKNLIYLMLISCRVAPARKA